MVKTKLCESEREFLELIGDGNEKVKITLVDDDKNSFSGWWLFYRTNNTNTFTKPHRDQKRYPKMVDRLICETKYLQFDKERGIIPESHHYNYSPLGELHPKERDEEIERLNERGMWH